MTKIVKNRIPNTFFITKGFGIDDLESHAGSYHIALGEAQIKEFNIIPYSSVLPATAKQVSLDEIDLPVYGSEMYCIESCMIGGYGEHISAGIIYAWMYKDKNFEEKYGGLVCEVKGHYTIEVLEERMYMVLNNLFTRTFEAEGLYLGEPIIVTQGGDVPNNTRYGCALVSLCFVDYLENE